MDNIIRFEMDGRPYTVELVKTKYRSGNNTAILAIDLNSEYRGEVFCEVTVNIASEGWWYAVSPQHITLDTNNMPEELFTALVDSGTVKLTDEDAVSGFCRYPKAIVNHRFLESMEEY